MTATQLLDRVNSLERQIETIKWLMGSLERTPARRHKNIVKTTSGILKKRLPSGILYENRLRRAWHKRFKTSG